MAVAALLQGAMTTDKEDLAKASGSVVRSSQPQPAQQPTRRMPANFNSFINITKRTPMCIDNTASMTLMYIQLMHQHASDTRAAMQSMHSHAALYCRPPHHRRRCYRTPTALTRIAPPAPHSTVAFTPALTKHVLPTSASGAGRGPGTGA
jgi:hypothetical protein